MEQKTIGARLRALRKEKDMTIEEVARQLNVASSVIGMYELDQRTPPADKLKLLADFYNVTTDFLLGRTDDPTPPGQAEKTPEERLREAGIEVWLRGEGLTEEDAELIKALVERMRKAREGKGEQPKEQRRDGMD